ncbi:MAG: RidA family protein [Rhizobiaceae bacterium]|nr:RidA family protein [Rhizobiaceae bacterium]
MLSETVAYGGTVWVAGMVARPVLAEASIQLQTADILQQLDERLAAVQSDRTCLLSVNVWLSDIADWAEMNTVWTEWLNGAPAPARATVQAAIFPPYRVEIAAVAAMPHASSVAVESPRFSSSQHHASASSSNSSHQTV